MIYILLIIGSLFVSTAIGTLCGSAWGLFSLGCLIIIAGLGKAHFNYLKPKE